jgi:hypothetical protein
VEEEWHKQNIVDVTEEMIGGKKKQRN